MNDDVGVQVFDIDASNGSKISYATDEKQLAKDVEEERYEKLEKYLSTSKYILILLILLVKIKLTN